MRGTLDSTLSAVVAVRIIPRMRGTLAALSARGTLDSTLSAVVAVRIIPAHAGNSRQYTLCSRRSTDHPRACGELSTVHSLQSSQYGSSPRMRGTLDSTLSAVVAVRIIPAHAGNSRQYSPRMRGTLVHSSAVVAVRIIPRAGMTVVSVRIIPAHAGNSRQYTLCSRRSTDHPRACGELSTVHSLQSSQYGSSPRMRGTLDSTLSAVVAVHPRACGNSRQYTLCDRIIPAHAGNSLPKNHY